SGGGADVGGELLNKGTLTLNNDTFMNNIAVGQAVHKDDHGLGDDNNGVDKNEKFWSFDDDDSGDAGFGGGGLGGAVFNLGAATVTNSTFVNNKAGSDSTSSGDSFSIFIQGIGSTTGSSNSSFISFQGLGHAG